MRPPPIEAPLTDTIWTDWFRKELYPQTSLDLGGGTTAQRPTTQLKVGSRYFDTTLGIPIWHDGTNWVNASGATV